jgi:hypothetical protein
MPAPFISRQDLTDYLGRNVTADDGALIAVDAACDTVRTVAEQTFNRTVGGTAVFDGTGTDALLLPELPVTAAGTVLVNGTAVTDYVLNDNGILFRRGSLAPTSTYYDYTVPMVWPNGRQNIEVTYDHGYADADLPRDVRMVALSLASRLVVQGVATEETLGDARVKYAGPATDLTAGEQMILRKYRRR